MSLLRDTSLSAAQLYLTAPYVCSYLPDRLACSQVVSPEFLAVPGAYSELVRCGFRRSGTLTYRPQCSSCRACIPVRVDVALFSPSRTQRRSRQRHGGMEISLHGLSDKNEYFDLYRRYQMVRHPDGDVKGDGREQYRNFLLQSHTDSMLVEFRDSGVLRMVSIVDILTDGLSSVYTFYEPNMAKASLGTYGILWQIDTCLKLKLDYLYLGYWIKESKKMTYKTNFSSLQGLVHNKWQALPACNF